VVGLIAAAFAYGRADIVVRNVSGLLRKLGPSPYAALRNGYDPALFDDFSHRFHKSADLCALLDRIGEALRRWQTLGALFQQCYVADADDIAPSLQAFVETLIALRPADETSRRSLSYLLTSPADGSACKRMNLYLRWMVRRTSPDLGLWNFVDPAKLVMPLDTHVRRISAFLGLSRRKSADWKTARELTTRLAGFDAGDPVRYDFAICRLGILDRCSTRRRKENCDVCLLRDVCRFPVR
jgi:uncharacterized protein (TIGR02757 family)